MTRPEGLFSCIQAHIGSPRENRYPDMEHKHSLMLTKSSPFQPQEKELSFIPSRLQEGLSAGGKGQRQKNLSSLTTPQ